MRISDWSSDLCSSDLAVRRDCALAIARHGRFAPLVALYANDVPAVSAIMLREVRLAEADWLALLPATSAMARSVLAGRSDLPQSISRALDRKSTRLNSSH